MYALSFRMVPLPQRPSIQSRKYAVVSYPASHLSPPEALQCGGAYPARNLTKSIAEENKLGRDIAMETWPYLQYLL